MLGVITNPHAEVDDELVRSFFPAAQRPPGTGALLFLQNETDTAAGVLPICRALKVLRFDTQLPASAACGYCSTRVVTDIHIGAAAHMSLSPRIHRLRGCRACCQANDRRYYPCVGGSFTTIHGVPGRSLNTRLGISWQPVEDAKSCL